MDKPTLPKGTRDFGPAVMARRQYIFDIIRNVFQQFGFQQLETPAMENMSTLTGKYGEEGDQLLFRILDSGDFLKDVPQDALETRNSKKTASQIAEKGLRYDLTVPFARFVVMNRNEVAFPFKRFQIQPVWRADRPQKGRYREFYQCDADVVGTNSLICEAEIILMIQHVFSRLTIEDYSIKINHRSILNGLAQLMEATGKETALFVAIDKLEKIGEQKVREELITKGFTAASIDILFETLGVKGNNTNKLAYLAARFATLPEGQKGLREIQEVLNLVKSYGASDHPVELDVSLARGLSYYTGTIFEVKINRVSVGSVSGGGRYDNLTQAFGDKDNLPGVGFSFGVDRLYDALEELNLFPSTRASSGVLVCHLDDASLQYGLKVLAGLRQHNIASEIFPDPAKLKKQLDYANKKNIPFTIVIGSDEMKSGNLAFRTMGTGTQENIPLNDIIDRIKKNNNTTF